MRGRGVVLGALLCALCTGPGTAQETRILTAADSSGLTSGIRTASDTVHIPRPEPKSTTTALLLSAALPGAGQAYNGAWWKVPIVVGLGVYFVAEIADNHRQYRSYRDRYTASQTPDVPTGDSYLLKLRNFYSSNRDTYVWYFVILYILNLVDAYVDASLSGFDVGSDLSFRALPGAGLQLRVRIP